MESIIVTYGYAAILVGTFLEGETILIIAGFLAHRGYLHLPFVILAAFTGSFLGDQLFFTIGRVKGQKFVDSHPRYRPRVELVLDKLNKYKILLILSFRFLYGLRTISPFAIGLSNVSALMFFALNLISAAAWAAAFGVGGYLFGHVVERILSDIKHFEYAVIGGVALIAAAIFIARHIREKRRLNKIESHANTGMEDTAASAGNGQAAVDPGLSGNAADRPGIPRDTEEEA